MELVEWGIKHPRKFYPPPPQSLVCKTLQGSAGLSEADFSLIANSGKQEEQGSALQHDKAKLGKAHRQDMNSALAVLCVEGTLSG